MRSLIIIFLLACQSSIGQQLNFKGGLVDTISIKSHVSAYQFDDNGTTIGKASIFSIAYDSIKQSYIVYQYYLDEYSRTFRPDTFQLQTKDLSSKIVKNIDSKNIENLLRSLDCNINSDNLIDQIDSRDFNRLVTEKRIRKIAKWYDIDWYFKRKYSTREDNDLFFKSCKSLDSLKTFIKYQFDTQGYSMVTDYSNTINILITTSKKQHRFEGKYPNIIKQPWYYHSDTATFMPATVLNLEVNRILTEILPTDFLLTETISNQALFDAYIIWYFERRNMKI